MKNKMFSIIDVETTGEGMRGNRMTKICIVKLKNGQVLEKYSTLIYPEKVIPQYITELTGISNEMVENAPYFFEVAKKIHQFTKDTIFVAHNVHFDYNIVRNEFRQLGFDFQRKKLCTVRLSKKLIPNLNEYSLSNLCSSINVPFENRHRAEEDADLDATVILFQRLLRLDGEHKVFEQFLNYKSKESSLPPHLNSKQVIDLPNSAGVYFFKNRAHQVIYVGKSKDIKKRVLSHIYSKKNKEYLLCQETFFIDFEETGTELTALLLESDLIKKHYPKFNRAQMRTRKVSQIISYKNKRNILQLGIISIKAADDSLQTFLNTTLAIEKLETLCKNFNLCPRYCGLQSNIELCSHYKISNCEGICEGTEEIDNYNKKVSAAVASLNSNKPSYIIYGDGRRPNEKSIVLVKEGIYRGFGYTEVKENLWTIEKIENFLILKNHTYHTNQILRSYFKKNPKRKVVHFRKETPLCMPTS